MKINISEIVKRKEEIPLWQPEYRIPYNDPEFSRRLLDEHLSQSHDVLTRRDAVIEKQVNWIHHHLLLGKKSKILDLGCGPGKYCKLLNESGHCCTGIDISPAAIEYAKENTGDCQFIEADYLDYKFNEKYDLIMLLFGDLNSQEPDKAINLLSQVKSILKPNGILLLEPLTFDAVKTLGENEPAWYTVEKGIFSDSEYINLEEYFWNNARQCAGIRYFIMSENCEAADVWIQSYKAYSDDELNDILTQAGFSAIEFYPNLNDSQSDFAKMLHGVVARLE